MGSLEYDQNRLFPGQQAPLRIGPRQITDQSPLCSRPALEEERQMTDHERTLVYGNEYAEGMIFEKGGQTIEVSFEERLWDIQNFIHRRSLVAMYTRHSIPYNRASRR